MALSPGMRLGPYEVQSELGAGGMGQVYRARDTRLDRTVAIKVLPDHVAADPGARQRLEREARAISALNHPHICTLFDVGQHEGIDYLVMEHLEGQTLAERLAAAGKPLPVSEVLSLAIQIAEALHKAHRAGIVHRDLKPGNIMLVRHGGASHAKLLDFGLAKANALGTVGAGASLLPTVPPPLTAQGTILGTFQYMAPEQLEGREADSRTDIFAFGAVLHEMLTGRKAFEGKSQASLIAAILAHDPPPVTTLQPLTPAALDHVVHRCLAKDPDERWQSALDIARELDWIARHGATLETHRPVAARNTATRIAWAAVVGGVFAIAIIAAVMMRGVGGDANARQVRRLAFARPAGTTLTNVGRPVLAISPDGRDVLFVADYQLYRRNLESAEAQPIQGTALGQIYQPFFSPDGEWVGFIDSDEGLLMKVPVRGGGALPIVSAGTVGTGFGAFWGTDDRVIFANADGIFRVSADGGTPERIVELREGEAALRPQLLPDGEHLLFTLTNGAASDRWDKASIVTHSLSTGERAVVLKGGADARYIDSGHLVYALGTDLFAVGFDARTRTVRGAPVLVERGVRRSTASTTGAAHFVTSARGDLAYLPDAPVTNPLTLINPQSGARSQGLPFSAAAYPRVSADGSQVAVLENDETWIYSLESGIAPRKFEGREPVWAHDGSRWAFRMRTESGPELWSQRGDGIGAPERIARGVTPIGWSGDTTFVFFDPPQIWAQHPERRPEALWNAAWGGSLSPDGQWVAFHSLDGGRNVAYIGSVRDPGTRFQISKEGGHHPVWSRDGRRVYYAGNSSGPVTALMAVDVRTRPSVTFGEPMVILEEINQPLNQARHYDVMPDGRLLVSIPDPRQSTISGEIGVVLNWVEQLKRLVPVQ